MWKTDLEIELNEQERQELERLDRSLTASHRAVIRARTILRLAAGMPVSAVAREVGRGRRIVRATSRAARPAPQRSAPALFPPRSPRTW